MEKKSVVNVCTRQHSSFFISWSHERCYPSKCFLCDQKRRKLLDTSSQLYAIWAWPFHQICSRNEQARIFLSASLVMLCSSDFHSLWPRVLGMQTKKYIRNSFCLTDFTVLNFFLWEVWCISIFWYYLQCLGDEPIFIANDNGTE